MCVLILILDVVEKVLEPAESARFQLLPGRRQLGDPRLLPGGHEGQRRLGDVAQLRCLRRQLLGRRPSRGVHRLDHVVVLAQGAGGILVDQPGLGEGRVLGKVRVGVGGHGAGHGVHVNGELLHAAVILLAGLALMGEEHEHLAKNQTWKKIRRSLRNNSQNWFISSVLPNTIMKTQEMSRIIVSV